MASWSNYVKCPEAPSRQQNSKCKGEGRLELLELQGDKRKVRPQLRRRRGREGGGGLYLVNSLGSCSLNLTPAHPPTQPPTQAPSSQRQPSDGVPASKQWIPCSEICHFVQNQAASHHSF